jgi:FkbM family methyltransferase
MFEKCKTVSLLDQNWFWPAKDRKALKYFSDRTNSNAPQEIAKFCKQHRAVIQAGGHCGLYPFQYSKIFENVYTFEPEELNHFCLTTNLQGIENVRIERCALGAEESSISLNINEKNCGNHSVDLSTDGTIPLKKIDKFKIENVDLIHLDLEGFELFALKGAQKTIKKYKPVIVLETNNFCENFNYTIDELEEWLDSINYTRLVKWPDDRVYVSKAS